MTHISHLSKAAFSFLETPHGVCFRAPFVVGRDVQAPPVSGIPCWGPPLGSGRAKALAGGYNRRGSERFLVGRSFSNWGPLSGARSACVHWSEERRWLEHEA